METKQTRENRKMRIATFATAALLVVLVGSGVAGASTVDITITLNPTAQQIADGGVQVGDSMAYTVMGQVTDNYYEPFSGYEVNGGLHGFKVRMDFAPTGAGLAHQKEHQSGAPGSKTDDGSPNLAFNSAFAVKQRGDIIGGVGGTGGFERAAGGQGSDPLTEDAWAYGEIEAIKTQVQRLYDTPFVLFSGNIEVLAGDPGDTVVADLDWYHNDTTSVYKVDSAAGLFLGQPDTVNISGGSFTIIPEPTTIGLLGFGVVALLRRRRRA